jgi:hypothetical protein
LKNADNPLQISNLIKFLNRLNTSETRSKFQISIEQAKELKEKDKSLLISMLKVVLCPAKCPCCGRVCGHVGDHPYHECLYGHQMRALNGTYLKKDSGVKEASVIRCEEIN